MNETVRMRAHETPSASAKAEAHCRRALELLLTQRRNPGPEVDRALVENPSCLFAHCVRLSLIVRADDKTKLAQLAESAAAIEAADPDASDTARRHAAAACAWAEGDTALALELYGAIVVDQPRDALALAVAHALDFRLGLRRMLRDRVAQVFPEWSAKTPGYASVLAMYAFGLEENGEYARAEKTARRALSLDPGHPGAIHVLAHVLEMQGRAREGIAFLEDTKAAWTRAEGLSGHLAWHKGLFHLDANQPAAALAIYDRQIAGAGAAGLNALADASALLWRLWIRDVDVGRRWKTLADRWERRSLAGVRPFYVVHAILAFSAARRDDAAARAFALLPAPTGEAACALALEDALASPLCEGIRAFALGDYEACVNWLGRVRHFAHRCGGSVAQCDLVQQTFIEAAFRARRTLLTRALVAERIAQRPASPFNRVLRRRLNISPAAEGDRAPRSAA